MSTTIRRLHTRKLAATMVLTASAGLVLAGCSDPVDPPNTPAADVCNAVAGALDEMRSQRGMTGAAQEFIEDVLNRPALGSEYYLLQTALFDLRNVYTSYFDAPQLDADPAVSLQAIDDVLSGALRQC